MITINDPIYKKVLERDVLHPLWLSISESAKVGGITNKTIRRAIHSKKLKYKIINDRYFINLSSVIIFVHSNAKLRNKFYSYGFGQYISKWQD